MPEPDKAAESITIDTTVENVTGSSVAEETSKKNSRSVRDWVWPF
jgi:hypothetical protein